MIQYSCLDKYIDVIVADSALPFWRSDVEFDCILADRNIKFIQIINNTIKIVIFFCLCVYSPIWY